MSLSERHELPTRDPPLDDRLYRQFLHIASHDLQEPLRKICTFADLLEKGLAEDRADDVDYALDVIRRSSRRARQLVQDLLTYARAQNRPVDLDDVDLREVLFDVLSTAAGTVIETRAVVSVEVPPTTVRADKLQLFQLLLNLVGNALRYRREGREPNVAISLSTVGGFHRLKVSDDGIGFHPDMARLIFEPFHRMGTDRDSGSGLGLAICRIVADRHGWTLEATGVPDGGATFVLVLPVP